MRLIALILSVAGFAFGLAAAYYWWKASRLSPQPWWPDGIPPAMQELEQMGWTVAFIDLAQKSGALNRIAASLTAIAVILTTAAGLASLLPAGCACA